MEVIRFSISDLTHIIVTSDKEDVSYYDDLTATLSNQGIEYPIGRDNIYGIIENFSDVIESLLDGENIIDGVLLFEKGMGYFYNIYLFSISEEIENKKVYSLFDDKNYFLWGNSSLTNHPCSAFIYEYKNNFYLEISKFYPWMYDDESEKKIEDWLNKDYGIIGRYKISKEKFLGLRNNCVNLMKEFKIRGKLNLVR